MTSGTLLAWKKKPGDLVRRGDIVAEVDTDKGVIDVEIFSTGVLEQLLVEPGNTVAVGTVLAIVRESDATGMDAGAAAGRTAPLPATVGSTEATASVRALPRDSPPVPAIRCAISPAARRRARELKVDPETVTGTGRGGAITIEDIERAAKSSPIAPIAPMPPPDSAPPARDMDRSRRMRQAIAAAMSRSKREIPHYYLSTTIDFHKANTWLTRENAVRPLADRLLHGVVLLKATAIALREVPELNATWNGDRPVPSPDIHLGVAISLRQGGLIAPALHHADRLTLTELMRKFRDLVQRARSGALRGSELSDATITVTNLGDQGVESAFGVIYPPQVAIVGFGKLLERPWVVDGQIVVRPVINATLSADHRVSDGHRGGLLLNAISRLLQEPEQL